MIQENEIVAFALAIGVLVFFITARLRLREFPAWKIFVASFCVCTMGWLFTVLEGLWSGLAIGPLLESLFNAVEHVCYAVTSLLFALWCWKALHGPKEVRP